MRKSLHEIEEMFDSFFEFPTEDKSSVTSTSCKLFAEHCVNRVSRQYQNEIDDLRGDIVQLVDKFAIDK